MSWVNHESAPTTINITPHNYLKHGMNLTSLETIMLRDIKDVRV